MPWGDRDPNCFPLDSRRTLTTVSSSLLAAPPLPASHKEREEEMDSNPSSGDGNRWSGGYPGPGGLQLLMEPPQ